MEDIFIDFRTVTDGRRPRGDRRPVVGLSVNIAEETSRLHEAYIKAVSDAGAVPVLVPAGTDADVLAGALDAVDALILTGGADVAGEYFGEPTLEGLAEVTPGRDAYDFLLLRLAVDRGLPVLGICRGVQVINIAFGGDIWQDIPSQYPGEPADHYILSPRHKPAHTVIVREGTVLARVIGAGETGVNSRHHQAIRRTADGFRVAATAPDGIVEAIEGYPSKRILGVQWHPENMAAEGDDKSMRELFRFFVGEASLFARAKRIHDKYITVDSHCDTPMLFGQHNIDFGRRDPVAQVDLVKMTEGRMDAAIVVAYIPQGPLEDAARKEATEKAAELLGEMTRQIEANRQHAALATNFRDVLRLKEEGRRAVMLGLENGYAVGRSLAGLEMFRRMGVVYVTLCHNGANDICDSAAGEALHGGLSPFGREVVREMNRLGMVVDLSHAAESTFYDVLSVSRHPVICSHSSARALRDHPRNLTDDQIRALAASGGVVQICLYNDFLVSDGTATVMEAVRHIDHIVRLVGDQYVGIGSDFDGGGGIEGCRGANEIINITVELLRLGYSEVSVARILGGNLRRVFDKVQGEAEII